MKTSNINIKLAAAAIILIVLISAGFILFNSRKPSPVSAPGKYSSTNNLPGRQVQHVVIVLEENTNYDNIIGNKSSMPYLNGLAQKYSYAKNYYGNVHPSMGNYFMLTAGQIISKNDGFSGTVSDDNIVREIIASGKTWKEYSEGIPDIGYTGKDTGNYTEHHNPLSYFSDVRQNSDQAKNLVPISQFSKDLADGNLPNFSFVVPDERNDAHDCPNGGSCTSSEKLANADQWLKTNIDPLFQNQEFNSPGGGILIVTFDEGNKSDQTNGGGHTAWVVAGPDIKKGYSSDTLYQHENTLRFISELLGLSNFPGKSATATGMNEFLSEN